MKPESSTSAIEAIVANILDTKYDNLDTTTVENAKNRIIDVVGCVIGGVNAPGNFSLWEVINDWGGKKVATKSIITVGRIIVCG